ncbi:bifunctional anthranilate synthase component I family protein/class IV aminotransferase [Allofrancisella guangzhouensis]|uniref:Chloroperoxidase n=1 Tax=Allofrancisella guangzhouensis TaxID=594679 RepID=A0A0A8E9T9_9GAMM|nr:bifunctional anthranilate synthase component I family protein/class IV aminotransferase [Allofrancisella guangzhouensis]AJC48931.1 chloroperoxidase [Allofrancisella guangzhouensis]MBK2027104.1 bifunctional anthranilate synthase component I family protein/class IV aminotransferase [Allofrancisella guangzhouensis]MBK2044098.1 bifunctional anthranilate synthase component I family protein/class IV aminotransferase [Allofrancisella guangzhouensis]MBK2045658.1 bifunctional anthranilate synthase co
MDKVLPEYALFEDSLTKELSYCFTEPVKELIATNETSLLEAFKEMLELQKQGLYLTGFVSYEASYYLNRTLAHLRSDNEGILLHFVAFKKLDNNIPTKESNKSIDLLIDNLSFDDYQKGFVKVQDALQNGESYQINYTKRIRGTTSLTGLELYTLLKKQQPVRYGTYLPFRGIEIISISPELFFKKQATKLIVRPMKGTAKLTGNINEDEKAYNQLRRCPKNRAENLIIVDLLRNDLSGIAKTHTVKVDEAFTIEKYNKLLQLTSEISAQVSQEISLKEILDSLFPCGSITGAPKKRTIELIKNIEKGNRGVYTGAIGYILPNNDMCFNVAIRTIQKKGQNLQIGVGGGVTIYSECFSEWQEMATKINFIKQIYKPDFSLVESMYFYNGFRNLELHLQRLQNTAERLFFNFCIDNVAKSLNEYSKKLETGKEYKVRLEYFYDQNFSIEHTEINNSNIIPIKLKICPEKIDSKNKLFNYKTTHLSTRGFYTAMYEKYVGNYSNTEIVFLNEFNNITETRFHNIIIEINSKKYTPKLSDGVLAGIARKTLISKKEIEVKSISLEEIKLVDKIYLINSVRGLIPAYLEI